MPKDLQESFRGHRGYISLSINSLQASTVDIPRHHGNMKRTLWNAQRVAPVLHQNPQSDLAELSEIWDRIPKALRQSWLLTARMLIDRGGT